LQEIRRLKAQYEGKIALYLGLEMDFIPGVVSNQSTHIASAGLDFTIGSIHYTGTFSNGVHCEVDGPHQVFLRGVQELFAGDVKAMVKAYFALTRQMIQTSPPDVVGHLDKIKMQAEEGNLFSEHSPWYQEEIAQTLEAIARQNLRVEVNTRGIYKKKVLETYPSPWILERMHQMDIPVVLSSDNHLPEEMDALFPETLSLLQKIGFQTVDVLYQGKWQPVAFHAKGLEIPKGV
jgi:histidinol-phosphatase (PHP family)